MGCGAGKQLHKIFIHRMSSLVLVTTRLFTERLASYWSPPRLLCVPMHWVQPLVHVFGLQVCTMGYSAGFASAPIIGKQLWEAAMQGSLNLAPKL